MKITTILTITFMFSNSLFSPFSYSAQTSTNFTVTKTEDTNDGVCDADCSLREAIITSNSVGGNNTIHLPSGIYFITLEGVNEDQSATGDLDIRSNLQIIGSGKDTTIIDGNHFDRIFNVFSPSVVMLSGISMINGQTDGQGGAIKNSSFLSVVNSALENNSSIAQGGAIMSQWPAELTILGTTISSNKSLGDGGGIFNSSTVTIHSSSITNNIVTDWRGGGISNNGGTVLIEKSTISGNAAYRGGGISSISFIGLATAYLTVKNSTISGNVSVGGGGGINSVGETSLNNVTITDNNAAVGGGIYGVAEISNSILAGNSANISSPDCDGSIVSIGHNLIEDTSACNISGDITGNIIGKPPNLGLLTNNGGLTETHALLDGSPAVNSGSAEVPGSSVSACEENDQRDITRPQSGRCDIGAYEMLAPILNINYTTGQAGSFFTVVGLDFPADELATITINGNVVVSDLLTDNSGSVIFILDTQYADPGIYFITVSVNPKATQMFRLDPLEPERPQEDSGRVIEVPSGIGYTQLLFLPLIIK